MRRLVTGREIFVQIWYFDKLILHIAFGEDFIERDRYDTSRANSDLFMSEVAPFKFARERNDKEMLEAMLESEPPALYRFSPHSRVMWRVSKPIEPGYFEEFWGKTNSSQPEPMMDWDSIYYDEWSSQDDLEVICRYYGMRNRKTGAPQGIVRRILNQYMSNGYLKESAYDFKGRINGFMRTMSHSNNYESEV